MNQETSQSYLDLSVLPELRTSVLSADPVVVFSENIDTIVWANAAGAQLFGGTGVLDLLSVDLPADNAVLRQLRHAVNQMDEIQNIVRGIRLSQTMRSQMLQFEIQRIGLPQSQAGFKVTQLIDESDANVSENELAQLAVKSFEGFADAAAIVDDHGLPISCSAEFAILAPDDVMLADLIEELKSEEDRLIKRPVEVVSEQVVAIGLARLTNEPGRNLVVIATVSEATGEISPDLEEQGPISAIVINEVSQTDTTAETEAEDDESLQDFENQSDDQAIRDFADPAETQSDSEQVEDREAAGLSGETAEDENSIEATPNSTETGFVAAEETPAEELAQEPDTANTQEFENQTDDTSQAPSEEDPATAETLEPVTESETTVGELEEPAPDFVRFAWSVDDTGTFVTVSEELADVVGKNPANIVGRRWSDIAEVMGFDRNGEIAALLNQKDTWSGKSVLWPIEGTDQAVPVDLAALPIYNTDRQFEGFRGYGKIAVSQIRNDPEALGLAFASTPEERNETENLIVIDEPDIAISGTGLDEKETDDTFAGLEQSGSNVLPFSRGSDKSDRQALTESERNALEAVRDHLQEQQSDDTNKNNNNDDEIPQNVDTSLLEILPLAVLIYRNDETLFANQRLLEASGYQTLDELVVAGGVSALLATDEDTEDKRNHFLLKKDGNRISVNAILHSVPWDGDKALLLSFTPPTDATAPDVLELTKVSEVQNILDTTTDGIILLDENGKIISINAPAEALFGLDFDDAVDQELEFLFADESKQTIRNYVDSVLTEGFESLINDGEEAIARESGGGMIPVYLTIARMDQTGKICAVIRDITNWKKAEEELIQSKQHAEQANEQKSEFLAQVSHEIRTPLNAIIGFSDVMIEERFGAIDNERYREYLRDIRRSGVHVLEIINELLDLSKVESGKLDLTFEAVNLNELVAETVALLQPQANTNRTIIRTSLSRSVPKVVADPRSIRQIILNLVSNAIKYSEANSQVIVSTVYETNGEVALRVRDTGKGMTPNEIEWAMKPFRQVHTVTENNPEGTGLGLPLTKALVEANRAYFELESNPGSGTIAHVQFPMQRVLAD